MMNKRLLCVVAGCLIGIGSHAQSSGTQPEGEVPKQKISYVPKIDGSVKAKVEFSLYDGEYRFNVRNSRFGVSGLASPNMNYRIQVDFSNEGKLSILDSYVGYTVGGFNIQLGQQQYRFSSDLDRGPSTNLFANRSFLAKYLTGYYGSELSGEDSKSFVKTLGSRDLGAMTSYNFQRLEVPLMIYLGVFNGSGTNNPEWSSTANVVTRVEYGWQTGFRGALSYYNGAAPTHTQVVENAGVKEVLTVNSKMNMVGGELRYVHGGFFIEGEYARRYLRDLKGRDQVLTAAHVHGFYKFMLPERSFANHIAPIARWDMGNNVDYLNMVTKKHETFNANRITAGLSIGFGEKMIRSELRLNYEKYLMKNRPSDYAKNKLLQDKFTIEVVAAF